MTIDEQITQAAAYVEAMRARLAAAEEELRILTALRDEEAIKELLAAAAGKGIGVADAIALIKAKT